jgi:hypothetical protein
VFFVVQTATFLADPELTLWTLAIALRFGGAFCRYQPPTKVKVLKQDLV